MGRPRVLGPHSGLTRQSAWPALIFFTLFYAHVVTTLIGHNLVTPAHDHLRLKKRFYSILYDFGFFLKSERPVETWTVVGCQMGSNCNLKAIFSPRVEQALRAWHKRAKRRLKLNALIEAESAGYKRRCKPIVADANYLWRKKHCGLSPHQLEITLPPMAVDMEDGSLARY